MSRTQKPSPLSSTAALIIQFLILSMLQIKWSVRSKMCSDLDGQNSFGHSSLWRKKWATDTYSSSVAIPCCAMILLKPYTRDAS